MFVRAPLAARTITAAGQYLMPRGICISRYPSNELSRFIELFGEVPESVLGVAEKSYVRLVRRIRAASDSRSGCNGDTSGAAGENRDTCIATYSRRNSDLRLSFVGPAPAASSSERH